MTAIAIAAQPKHGLIHVASDSAHYTPDGVVQAFGNKILPVSHWPGFVVNTGNGGATPLLGSLMSKNFDTFDDLVAGIEGVLPDFVKLCELSSGADVIIGGISADRGPESYMFKTDDGVPLGNSREEAEASEYFPDPFKLVKLPDHVETPIPTDQIVPANFEGFDLDADPALVVWTLKKILEMQHRSSCSMGGVGGFAEVVTISADGIHSRIVTRWPEDCLGEPINALPIDWKQWHRDNPRPVAGVLEVAAGASRLKRQMAERKARKNNLAVVT